MEFYWTNEAKSFFKKEALKKEFIDKVKQKLPTFIENNFFRIKPIKEVNNCYELKIHAGKDDYRTAFILNDDKITICYISSELQKHKFDKQFSKWWKNNQDTLDETLKMEK